METFESASRKETKSPIKYTVILTVFLYLLVGVVISRFPVWIIPTTSSLLVNMYKKTRKDKWVAKFLKKWDAIAL